MFPYLFYNGTVLSLDENDRERAGTVGRGCRRRKDRPAGKDPHARLQRQHIHLNFLGDNLLEPDLSGLNEEQIIRKLGELHGKTGRGKLISGSDAPGEEILNPLEGIHLAMNRKGSEGITVREALKCYTTGRAHAEFGESRKGMLKPGMAADFIILSENPLTAERE